MEARLQGTANKWRSIAIVASWLVAGPVKSAVGGTFTLDLSVAGIPDAIPNVSKALIIVDTEADGFLGFGDQDRRDEDVRLFPFRSGAAVGDDRVLGVMSAFSYESFVIFESGVIEIDREDPQWSASLRTDKPLGLLVLYQGHLKPGAPIGFYRSDSLTDPIYGGNHPYRVPTDGTNVRIMSVSSDLSLIKGNEGGVNPQMFSAMNRELGPPSFGEAVGIELKANSVGVPMLRLDTPQAALYVVEYSRDLVNWSLLDETELVESESVGQWEVVDSEANEVARSFYRAWRSD